MTRDDILLFTVYVSYFSCFLEVSELSQLSTLKWEPERSKQRRSNRESQTSGPGALL